MNIEAVEIKIDKGIQAIRIPKAMSINDNKVYLKKMGNMLFIIPYHNPWQNLIESTDAFTADFMDQRNQPDQQTRDFFEL
ncbi:MAG: AbrB/MazE/SpoVT family DNA-binding domain-containing protein [Bacteroidales bacterium]|nr:AbrB/MazE/SpoVT family DNA-binding domain-containing protein [Bacteroidales bacterium]